RNGRQGGLVNSGGKRPGGAAGPPLTRCARGPDGSQHAGVVAPTQWVEQIMTFTLIIVLAFAALAGCEWYLSRARPDHAWRAGLDWFAENELAKDALRPRGGRPHRALSE